MIGPARASIGARRHRVTLDVPDVPVPDGDGGFTQGVTPLNPPALYASLEPVSGTEAERTTNGTVTAMATHHVKMPYHPGVTTQTRVHYDGRTFHVQSVTNVGERNVELELLCHEVLP